MILGQSTYKAHKGRTVQKNLEGQRQTRKLFSKSLKVEKN